MTDRSQPPLRHSHVQRDSVAAVARDLREASTELRDASTTRDVADAYHARIDAQRTMERLAVRLDALQGAR